MLTSNFFVSFKPLKYYGVARKLIQNLNATRKAKSKKNVYFCINKHNNDNQLVQSSLWDIGQTSTKNMRTKNIWRFTLFK